MIRVKRKAIALGIVVETMIIIFSPSAKKDNFLLVVYFVLSCLVHYNTVLIYWR